MIEIKTLKFMELKKKGEDVKEIIDAVAKVFKIENHAMFNVEACHRLKSKKFNVDNTVAARKHEPIIVVL